MSRARLGGGGFNPVTLVMLMAMFTVSWFFIQSPQGQNSTSTQFVTTQGYPTIQPYAEPQGADVVFLSSSHPQHTWNGKNIAAAVAGLAGVSAGLLACGDVTLGLCDIAAEAGGGATIASIAGNSALSVSSPLTFDNEGYATAVNWTFVVITLVNGTPVFNSTGTLPSIQAGQRATIKYTHNYDVGDVPGMLWNTVGQKPSNVTFEVVDISPPVD
jgi:hypothetical protein